MHNSIRIRTYQRHWRARRTTTRPPLTVVNEDAEYFKQKTTSLFLSFFLCLYLLSRNTRRPFCQRPLKCVGSFRLFRSPFAFAKIYIWKDNNNGRVGTDAYMKKEDGGSVSRVSSLGEAVNCCCCCCYCTQWSTTTGCHRFDCMHAACLAVIRWHWHDQRKECVWYCADVMCCVISASSIPLLIVFFSDAVASVGLSPAFWTFFSISSTTWLLTAADLWHTK